jgi:N-methylhydantoinase B
MRAEIASLTDGTYEAVDRVDGFGDDPDPIEVHVSLTIQGDELVIDFTATSEQVDASLNCPLGLIHAACYCAIRGVTRADIPNCEGYMTPIRVIAPPGTVVNPVLPAACGARGVIGYRVYDTIMRALAQVVPERVVAAGEGGPTLIAFGGYDAERRPFGTTEVIVGAWGARATRDGLEGVSNPLANLSNQPIELLESDLPLEVVQYRLVPDSGGAGAHRGGLPGGPSRNTAVLDGVEVDVPPMPMSALTLARGDRFRHRSAGGGGFGPPLAREPALVLDDVLAGKVTLDAARELYGVVLTGDPLGVDAAATAALREGA